MSQPTKLQRCVLLDGAKVRPLYRYLYSQESQPQWMALYSQTELEPLSDISPVLVSVQPDSPLLYEVEQTLGPEGKAIKLESFEALEVVGEHLRNMLFASRGSGERILFRFYEARAFEVLQDLPVTRQTHQFFGPVQSFSWVSPQYLFWRDWQRPDTADPLPEPNRSLPVFPLPDEWGEALKKAQQVPTAAQILRFLKEHPAYLGNRDTPSLLAYARKALEYSSPLKPKHWEEVQEYFDLCLLHGPDFLSRQVIPGTAGILADPALSCSEKLQRLNDRSLFI